MKKFLAISLTVILAIGLFAIGTSAATKSEILEEAAKSPVYHWVQITIEDAARSVEITEEQGDLIMPHVQAIVAAVPEDLGPTAHVYPKDQVETVMHHLAEICDILNYRLAYEEVHHTDLDHAGDIVVRIYNSEGQLVVEYDGDDLKQTDVAEENSAWIWLAVGSAFVLAAAAVLVITKKRGLAE